MRAAWLAALGLHRLAGGDVLGLARARDRLLERLFHTGLRPEQDLPSFLRFSGPAGEPALPGRAAVAGRAGRQGPASGSTTRGRSTSRQSQAEDGGLRRSDLRVRPGPARRDRRLQPLLRAGQGGAGRRKDEAHEFLLEAFEYRIARRWRASRTRGPLPTEQMEYLEPSIEERSRTRRRRAPALRTSSTACGELSRILEPDQEIDPYRHCRRVMNELERRSARTAGRPGPRRSGGARSRPAASDRRRGRKGRRSHARSCARRWTRRRGSARSSPGDAGPTAADVRRPAAAARGRRVLRARPTCWRRACSSPPTSTAWSTFSSWSTRFQRLLQAQRDTPARSGARLAGGAVLPRPAQARHAATRSTSCCS